MAAHRKAALKLSIPDMEETKNKKIVQLTKVVYHLNTQHEDHQREIKNLAKTYEAEIQQILSDSYAKIEEIRQSSKQWERKALDNVLYKDLLQQYQHDKALAARQLQEIKSRHKQQLDEMRHSYREQVETLQSDCHSTKQQMVDRIAAFKQLVDSIKQNHSTTTAQMKHKYDRDLLALSTKHQDTISAKNDTFDRLKKSLITRHEKETAKLNVQYKIRSQQLQSTHSQQIQSLHNKQHHAILELKATIDAIKHDKAELSAQVTSSQNMMVVVEAAIAKHEDKERALSAKIDKLEQSNDALQTKLKTAEQGRQRAQQRSSDTTLALQSKQKELDSLHKTHAQITKLMEGKDSQFIALSNNHKKFKEQMDILQTALHSEKLKLKEITAEKLKAATAAEREQHRLQSSLKAVRKELSSVTDRCQRTKQQLKWAETRYSALAKRLKGFREGMKSTKCTVMTSNREITNLKEQWVEFDKSCKMYFQVLQDGVSVKHQQLKQQQSSQLKALEMEYEAKLRAMQKQQEAAGNQWESRLGQSKKELQCLREEHNALLHDHTSHLSNSVQLKAVISERNTVIEQLKNEALDQHGQITKNIAQKDEEIAILREKLELQSGKIGEHESAHKNATKYLKKIEREHKDERKRLELLNQQTLKEKMRAIQQMEDIERETNLDQSQWRQKLQKAKQQHDQQLTQCRESSHLEIANLTKEFKDNISSLQEAHQSAMDRVTRLHNEQMERETNDRQSHQEREQQTFHLKVKEMRASHEVQIQTLTQTYKVEMAKQQEDANKAMDRALQRQQRQAEATMQEMRQQFDREVVELTEQNDGTMNLMLTRKQQEITALKGNIDELENDISTLRQSIDDKVKQLQQQETDFEGEKKELYDFFKREKREVEEQRQQLFTEWKAEKAQRDHEQQQEIRELNQKYEVNITEMKQKCVDLQAVYEKLHKKYQGRPSRKEDLEKINELNDVIKKQKQRVETTEKSMVQLKKELMNREKNYNSMFGRQPTIGVMSNSQSKIGSAGKRRK